MWSATGARRLVDGGFANALATVAMCHTDDAHGSQRFRVGTAVPSPMEGRGRERRSDGEVVVEGLAKVEAVGE